MGKRLTPADIVRRIEEKNNEKFSVLANGDLTVGGQVTVRCKTCGTEYTAPVNTLLYKGLRCANCCTRESDRRKLENFKRLRGDFLELAEPSGFIQGWHDKTRVKCKTCGYEWELPTNALLDASKGRKFGGCPMCINRSYSKGHDAFVQELAQILPTVSVLDTYVNNYTPIRVRDNQCGHEWEAKASSLLEGHGCQRCKRQNHFLELLKERRPNTELLSEYTDSRLYVKVRCRICGTEWHALASALINYPSDCCANCAEKSLGEKRIAEVLERNDIAFIQQYKFGDCRIKRALPFDFYIPSYNLCIEYDGEQHFFAREFFGGEEAYRRQTHRDAVKTEYCRDNGINLLRIPYKKFNHIEDIIISYINSSCLARA